MAKEPEKTDQPSEAKTPEPAATSAAPKRGKMLTAGLFGGVMLVEGVAIFMAMKMMGSEPDPTVGMEHGLTPTTKPWEESQEINVARVRVPNTNGTRTLLYSVKVVIRVNHQDHERVQEFIEGRKSTVEDTISRVVRSADEQHLAEPGLETLKRRVRFELGALLGDEEVIEQVLIPECMPLPANY